MELFLDALGTLCSLFHLILAMIRFNGRMQILFRLSSLSLESRLQVNLHSLCRGFAPRNFNEDYRKK
jgi:hypothetical protein